MSIFTTVKVRDFFKVHQGQQKKRFTVEELKAFNEHGFHCVYCNATSPLTADHVVPKSMGGCDEAWNLVPACLSCNSSRRNGDIEEFREEILAQKIAFETMHFGVM